MGAKQEGRPSQARLDVHWRQPLRIQTFVVGFDAVRPTTASRGQPGANASCLRRSRWLGRGRSSEAGGRR